MLTINPDTLTDTQAEAAINYILTLRPDCLGAETSETWTQKTFTAPVAPASDTAINTDNMNADVAEHVPGIPTAEGPEGAPDRDAAGLPWDERIHASSKATVADGTWRKKRGVDDATVAAVEAELRSHETNLTATNEELIEQAEPLDVPEAPEPTVPAPPVEANPFLAIMKRVTAAQTAGKFPKEKRDEILAAAGVDSIIKLNNNPDAVATFGALLDAEGL